MQSRRPALFILILISLQLIPSRIGLARSLFVNNQQLSETEMIDNVERSLQFLTLRSDSELLASSELLGSVETQLKGILRLYPKSLRRDWFEENLSRVQEILGVREFEIGRLYFKRGHSDNAAEARLLHIAREYPRFSRMDEVLLLLGRVYLAKEQSQLAVKCFWNLICRYPGSKNREDAFELLNQIGFDASTGCTGSDSSS